VGLVARKNEQLPDVLAGYDSRRGQASAFVMPVWGVVARTLSSFDGRKSAKRQNCCQSRPATITHDDGEER